MNKKSITLILVATASATHAATVIPLIGDADNSSAPAFGSGIVGTTTDTFAYDPLNPDSADPDLEFDGTTAFHGNEAMSGDVTLSYNLTHTVSATETTIVFDIWGRTNGVGAFDDRDDNFNVEIFNETISLGSLTGLGISASSATPNNFARASFAVSAGTDITRVVVTGIDSSTGGPTNNFTVQEVRFAAIPEPSVALLGGLALLGFIGRRRK